MKWLIHFNHTYWYKLIRKSFKILYILAILARCCWPKDKGTRMYMLHVREWHSQCHLLGMLGSAPSWVPGYLHLNVYIYLFQMFFEAIFIFYGSNIN